MGNKNAKSHRKDMFIGDMFFRSTGNVNLSARMRYFMVFSYMGSMIWNEFGFLKDFIGHVGQASIFFKHD